MYFNHHISTNIVRREAKFEPFILESPKVSYFYSKQVLKGRWLEAEKTLLGKGQSGYVDPEYVYLYAKNVLKTRWKEGEKVLLEHAKNPAGFYWGIQAKEAITFYAKHVIKGRWKKAELFIATSPNIGLYIELLNEQDLVEFKRMVTLEAMSGSEISKRFFSWKPTHTIKMKGSKAFEVMLEENDQNEKAQFGSRYSGFLRAFRLKEWLEGSRATDIAYEEKNKEWLWKIFGRRSWGLKASEMKLQGTVTPIG